MKVRDIVDLVSYEQNVAIYVKGEAKGFKGKLWDMPWGYANCEVNKIGAIEGEALALEVEKWDSITGF